MWGPEGKELFYWSDAGLIAVPVDTENSFTPGTPEVLFALDGYAYDDSRNYAVAPDGKRFLMIKESPTLDNASVSAAQINPGPELG